MIGSASLLLTPVIPYGLSALLKNPLNRNLLSDLFHEQSPDGRIHFYSAGLYDASVLFSAGSGDAAIVRFDYITLLEKAESRIARLTDNFNMSHDFDCVPVKECCPEATLRTGKCIWCAVMRERPVCIRLLHPDGIEIPSPETLPVILTVAGREMLSETDREVFRYLGYK